MSATDQLQELNARVAKIETSTPLVLKGIDDKLGTINSWVEDIARGRSEMCARHDERLTALESRVDGEDGVVQAIKRLDDRKADAGSVRSQWVVIAILVPAGLSVLGLVTHLRH